MGIKIEIPNYDKSTGIKYVWEDGFEILVAQIHTSTISANKEGLISLASHLLNLA